MSMVADDTTDVPLVLNELLNSCLSLFCFLHQLLLMLLLSESVQELVRLSEDLWNQSVFIKVLNVENLSAKLVVLVCSLVNV